MEYKKKILVTGGAGFIGSNFLNKFVLKYPEYFFINADLLTYAGNQKNILVSEKKNYAFEKADVRDLAALETIFKKYAPTDTIHFAAETHVDFSIENPSVFVETNVLGTHNLLILAKKYGIKRFHQVSTDEVYGSLSEGDPAFTTATPLAPNSPYSASKTAADLLVRSYWKTYGLDAVITRCSNNYGPNQDVSKLIPKAITNLLAGKKVPIYAKGEITEYCPYTVKEKISATGSMSKITSTRSMRFSTKASPERYITSAENAKSAISISSKSCSTFSARPRPSLNSSQTAKATTSATRSTMRR